MMYFLGILLGSIIGFLMAFLESRLWYFINVVIVFGIYYMTTTYISDDIFNTWWGEFIAGFGEFLGVIFVVFSIARLIDYINDRRTPKQKTPRQVAGEKIFVHIVKMFFR